MFTTIGHQWRPTGKLLPLGDQWPLTWNTPPKVLPIKQWKPTGRLLPLGRTVPALNSQEESHGSNDMAHNHYLEDAKKKTQERNRNSKPSVIPSVRLQNTVNDSTPNPKRMNQTSRSLPTSKSRWKPTGKIFTAVGLKWIPKGKLFDSCTGKVDSEPPNGSNDDITNPYECDQTLNVSAGTLNLSGVQASDLNVIKMASADNTSGPALQRKESTGPAPTFLTPGQISSGLVLNSVPATPYVPPTNKELEILFQPMFDEYMEPPRVERQVSPAPAVSVPVNSAGTPSSTTIDQDAPSPSHSPSSLAFQYPSLHKGIAADSTLMEDNPFAPVDNHPFINVFAPEPSSEASSSGDLSSAESPYVSRILVQQNPFINVFAPVSQKLHHLRKWSKDHPLDNIIGNPSRPVSTRKQLATDALWCLYNSVLSKVEPKNFKSAITEDCWFQAMQDEIHDILTTSIGNLEPSNKTVS
ncbi:hypothetical protein Tco_0494220 [Tanacetum coccineum]